MLRSETELTNLAYHTKDNTLLINQKITNPENILRIAEYINKEQIEIVRLHNITPE